MLWNSLRLNWHSLSLHTLQVGPKGKVIGIDHIKELVDDSINNVKKDDPSLITSGRVKLIGRMSLMKDYRHVVRAVVLLSVVFRDDCSLLFLLEQGVVLHTSDLAVLSSEDN